MFTKLSGFTGLILYFIYWCCTTHRTCSYQQHLYSGDKYCKCLPHINILSQTYLDLMTQRWEMGTWLEFVNFEQSFRGSVALYCISNPDYITSMYLSNHPPYYRKKFTSTWFLLSVLSFSIQLWYYMYILDRLDRLDRVISRVCWNLGTLEYKFCYPGRHPTTFMQLDLSHCTG